MQCAICEEKIKKGEEYIGQNGTEYQGKPICEVCFSESEPCATVFHNGNSSEPEEITSVRNDTGGDFTVEWVSTDAWRGCYKIKPSEEWEEFHSDCILAYSEDAEELKKFDDNLKEVLRKKEIEFAVVISRISNVFSSGYDFFVKKNQIKDALKRLDLLTIVNGLKVVHRDPERFAITALTGKNRAHETNEKDRLLVEAYQRIKAGEEFETIKVDILERAGVDVQ